MNLKKGLRKIVVMGLVFAMALGCTGTVALAEQMETVAGSKAVLPGDANGDGKVDLQDAQLVLKVALKIAAFTEEGQEALADVDGEAGVKLSDAQLILKAALKIITLDKKEEPTEVPIVQAIGNVDEAQYEKAVKAFEPVVKKMRADGLVKADDICVTMDGSGIVADITFDNEECDLILLKDNKSNSYTLIMNYDFTWLEGFGPTVNGKDPAHYNKDILIAMLSMVSDEPEVVFDRIDLDCFSAFGLYGDKWTQIADCFLMNDGMKVDEYISYKITTEDVDSRDASYILSITGDAVDVTGCVIEYDSSKVAYELTENGADYLRPADETKDAPYGYPVIKKGCSSYEEYKENLLAEYKAMGDSDAHITEYSSHRVNGYTYYWLEGFYETETKKGDPDIIYVQIGENEYVELYNVIFHERLEDFINSSFVISEVNK